MAYFPVKRSEFLQERCVRFTDRTICATVLKRWAVLVGEQFRASRQGRNRRPWVGLRPRWLGGRPAANPRRGASEPQPRRPPPTSCQRPGLRAACSGGGAPAAPCGGTAPAVGGQAWRPDDLSAQVLPAQPSRQRCLQRGLGAGGAARPARASGLWGWWLEAGEAGLEAARAPPTQTWGQCCGSLLDLVDKSRGLGGRVLKKGLPKGKEPGTCVCTC